MADGKRWFKVWTSIIMDQEMMLLPMEDRGRWMTLGALTAHNGGGGVLKIKPALLSHLLQISDVTMLQKKISILPNVKINISGDDSCTVTFINWHKYQVDSSAERTAKYRQNVTMQEEKRREEKRIRREKKNTLVENDKIIFDRSNFKFINLNGKKEIYKEKFPALDIDAEIKKAEAWLMSNPQNLKSNYERFLNNWFTRAQDRAPRKEDIYI